MTSPGQLGQAPEDSNEQTHEADGSPRNTRRRPADRFSLPRHKSAWLGITLSLIVLAGVSAVLIAVAVSGGSHPATSGGTSAATGGALAPGSIKASPVNQASKARIKGPSAAQMAESGGALRLPANMQSRAIAWQLGPGGTQLTAVTREFGDALQAAGARQYFVMRSFCIQLARSISAAEAGPQIPVAAMQIIYGQALTELAKGASDCRAAITMRPGNESLVTKVNPAMRQQAAAELAAGATDIFRSTALIEIASRQHH
jgi:hypothetical protein